MKGKKATGKATKKKAAGRARGGKTIRIVVHDDTGELYVALGDVAEWILDMAQWAENEGMQDGADLMIASAEVLVDLGIEVIEERKRKRKRKK